MGTEPLDYQALRKRQQAERASPKLTRLDGDLYRPLERYLQGLQEDYQREQATNPGSSKATLLGDELQNTRRLAEDLYEQRERKIVAAAQAAGRGAAPEHANMLKEEQELYEALVALLRETKRRVLHGWRVPAPAPAAAPPVSVQGSPDAAPAPSPAPPAPAPEGARVLVRALDDIGAFAASDLRTYHVQRDDVLDLPADTAKILVLRGKAVEVAPSA